MMTPQKAVGPGPIIHTGSMTMSNTTAKRRHLPIEQKKKVFNEWGAVLQHQDEVE